MLTGYVVDCMFTLSFNIHSTINRNREYYEDLLNIINIFKKNSGNEIPIDFSAKIKLFEKILNLLIEGKSLKDALSSINFNGDVFSDLKDYVEFTIRKDVDENEIEEMQNRLAVVRETCMLMKNMKDINTLTDRYNDGTYETQEEINDLYKKVVSDLYTEMMDIDRRNMLNSGGSVYDIETHKTAFRNMLMNHEPMKKMPTGYTLLDCDILKGGYSKKGLYINAGSTGSGKSTLMKNESINMCMYDYSKRNPNDPKPKKLIIYLSLEDVLEEVQKCMYAAHYNITVDELINTKEEEIEGLVNKFIEDTEKYGNKLIMEYKSSMSVSVNNIRAYLDSKLNDFPGYSIGALFIDYISHIKSADKGDYRMQLGSITREFKNLAIDYNIPVILAAQLNKEGLKVNSSFDLNIGMIAESYQIAQDSDTVFLLARDRNNENIVHFNSGKQRNGVGNVAIDFHVDFSKLKFISCCHSKKIEKEDDKTKKPSKSRFDSIIQEFNVPDILGF